MYFQSFITVRTASTRLPKKCLLPFGDCNVLEHIVRRAKSYDLNPIICTTLHSSDDIIIDIAEKENVRYFRGSTYNKLKRWLDCCGYFQVKEFHTIDADDPFFDGDEIKRSMLLLQKGFDMVCPTITSSAGGASVGYSLTKNIIDKACAQIEDNHDTEMMWHFISKVEDIKETILPEGSSSSLPVRLTLDYEEDYWLLRSIKRILGNNLSRQAVECLLKENPELYKINWFRNKEWEKNQKKNKI